MRLSLPAPESCAFCQHRETDYVCQLVCHFEPVEIESMEAKTFLAYLLYNQLTLTNLFYVKVHAFFAAEQRTELFLDLYEVSDDKTATSFIAGFCLDDNSLSLNSTDKRHFDLADPGFNVDKFMEEVVRYSIKVHTTCTKKKGVR